MSVVVLSGGVGGAKLSLGFYELLPADQLTVIVNTADDFDHLGLRICPDIDTTLYTLAGLANPTLGWGRANESWQFMDTMKTIGGETWFQLGDGDLALHIARTQALRGGQPLSDFVQQIAKQWGIDATILPMTNQTVATQVLTDSTEIPFQEYFVRQQCQPVVKGIRFEGVEQAQMCPDIKAALADPHLQAIVIAPSNPYLSVDPILSVPGMKEALRAASVPIIAVTPVIGDSAVKGPTTKIMRELQLTPSALTVAQYYEGLIDGFLFDSSDVAECSLMPMQAAHCDTLMKNTDDKKRVASAVLSLAEQIIHARQVAV